MAEEARSFACIQKDDLLHLAALAAKVEAGLFARTPDGAGRYAEDGTRSAMASASERSTVVNGYTR